MEISPLQKSNLTKLYLGEEEDAGKGKREARPGPGSSHCKLPPPPSRPLCLIQFRMSAIPGPRAHLQSTGIYWCMLCSRRWHYDGK